MKRMIHQKRNFLRQNIIAIMGVCLSLYFGYHMMAGERSFVRLQALNYDIHAVQIQHKSLTGERIALERKVQMMRPSSISRDLLEERVSVMLGYAGSDSKTIFLDTN